MPWKEDICHTGFSSPPEGKYWIGSCSLHLGHKAEIYPYLSATPCRKKGKRKKNRTKIKIQTLTNFFR